MNTWKTKTNVTVPVKRIIRVKGGKNETDRSAK